MKARTNTSGVEPRQGRIQPRTGFPQTRGVDIRQGADPAEAGVDPYSKRGCAEDREEMNGHPFQRQGGEHGGTVRAYEGQHHKIDGAKYGEPVMRPDTLERPGDRLPLRKSGFPVK